MRRAFFVFVILAAVLALAQDTSQITIKSGEMNNGVVIIAAVEGKTTVELQCNKGVTGCKIPEPGTYVLVRLPKNHGMYDCANVEIFPKGADPTSSERIGAFCLIAK
jgi:hypothetical protein